MSISAHSNDGKPAAVDMRFDDVLTFDEFDEALVSAQDRFAGRIDQLDALVATRRVYLFGYGGKGRALALQIASGSSAEVVVYDARSGARDMAAREGFATIDSLDDVRGERRGVILGACQAQLEQAALVRPHHIYYQEAAYLFDTPHLANKARDFSRWIPANKEALYKLYVSLNSKSRAALVDILKFRLSLDPHDLAASRKENSDMWFDVLEGLPRRNYSTFLDVGAYDGDTLGQARRRLSVTRGIAVEANTALFESIERVAATYDNGIRIVPHAAWSHRCRLHFCEVRGGMISVAEAEDGELQAAPIDEGIDERVDLVKMDIEGAELAALQGCLRTLRSGPDLAIAAYHRPDDLLRIPAFLERVGYARPAFDMHVAHYSDCFDDTILYFVKA